MTTIKVIKAYKAGNNGDEILVLANGSAVALNPEIENQLFVSEAAALASWAEVGLSPYEAPSLATAWSDGWPLAAPCLVVEAR